MTARLATPTIPQRVAHSVAAALVLLVRLYQWTLRPFIGAHCRFEPSCSHYAIEALHRHGPVGGTGLATRRILRCNPWTPGGWDPVPCPCHTKATAR